MYLLGGVGDIQTNAAEEMEDGVLKDCSGLPLWVMHWQPAPVANLR